MRVLILGVSGMLGHKLFQVNNSSLDVYGTCRAVPDHFMDFDWYDPSKVTSGLDVSNIDQVTAVIDNVKPAVLINAVGVIKQLPSSKQIVSTLELNSIFPQRLSKIASERGIRLIQISTDCVFSGSRGGYSEDDVPDATDLYGQSKRWGEVSGPNDLTIRTSIIGHELSTSHSLVDWFLSNRGKAISGFTGAIYSGFPTVILAEIVRSIIVEHRYLKGLFHVSSEPISKFELLQMINEEYKAGIEILPVDEPRIDRSLNSSRFRNETGFAPIPWTDMVKQMRQDAKIYGNIL